MLGQLWICLDFMEAGGILVALWWHRWGLLVQTCLCTSDVLGCAGTQRLLAHQPPCSLPAVGLAPHTPFCLLSSALFNFSGKPFPWSAVSRLTAGQGELPGQAVLENNSDLSQQSWCFNICALHQLCEMVISHTGVMGVDASLGLLSPVRVRLPGPSPCSAWGAAQEKICSCKCHQR